MSRTERGHSYKVRGALLGALWLGAAGACGDESKGGGTEDPDASTVPRDGGTDAGRDAGGRDGSTDSGSGWEDEPDAGPVDPAMPGDDDPTVARVGYYTDTTYGPRVLIQGRDPNGDVMTYRMQLLKSGQPVSIDPDGDGILPSSNEWTAPLSPTPGEAGFSARFEPSLVFLEAVDQVIVTVADAMNNVSAPVMSNVAGPAPTAGATCDPLGFNRCGSSSVCAPTTGTSYTCRTLSSVRMSACSAAPVLEVGGTLRGRISAPSRWNAPMGCTNAASNQPDAVFRLRLAAPGSVLLTVVGENTGFDSLLYVLGATAQACAGDVAACGATCLCEDGDGSLTGLRNAVLRLSNLPAGDHYIAIDSSAQPENTSTRFEVTATAQ